MTAISFPTFPPINGAAPDFYELRFYAGGYWHIFSCFCKCRCFILLASKLYECSGCSKRYNTNGDNRPKEVENE